MERATRGAGIGVFFANGIGDHIMTLPALRALLQVLPPRVVLFAMPEFRHVLLADLVVAGDVPIHLSMVDGRNRFDVAESFDEDLDLFVSLNPWHSVDVDRLLKRLRPTLSVGMHKDFDIWVRPIDLEHSTDRAFRVATAIDSSLRVDDFTQPPSLSDRAMRTAWRILERLPGDCHVMAVHNDTLPHKIWSCRRLGKVLKAFLSSHEDVVAISVDRENKPPTPERTHPRLFAPGSLPLDVALAIVSQSDFFLGVDSCMLHMADFCRVPGVGLFGPDKAAALGSAEMGFRFGPHRHVSGRGSMDGIRTNAVLSALEELTPRSPGMARRHRQRRQ